MQKQISLATLNPPLNAIVIALNEIAELTQQGLDLDKFRTYTPEETRDLLTLLLSNLVRLSDSVAAPQTNNPYEKVATMIRAYLNPVQE